MQLWPCEQHAATDPAVAAVVCMSLTAGELPRVPSMPARSLLMRKLVQMERLLRPPAEQQAMPATPADSKQQVCALTSWCCTDGHASNCFLYQWRRLRSAQSFVCAWLACMHADFESLSLSAPGCSV